MTFLQKTISQIRYARFAGLLYLLIAITGGFSIAYMPSVIVVADNATTTVHNLLEHFDLFRIGILGDIIVLVLEIILTVMLYNIFKPVSSTFALIAAYSRMAMSIVMALNLLNYLIPILLIKDVTFSVAFEADQLNAWVLLFLKVHKYGEFVWQIFFSLHLFVLGYLIIQSALVPKWLGYLMLIGSFGYAGECMSQILQLEGKALAITNGVLLTVATAGELIFTFWLLIKGVQTIRTN